MITLYHAPLSPNSRRVWITLLEKELPFELVEVNLTGGDQFQPDFLAMNPFHHIPVLVDGETTLIESFAILDYLEAQYPTPPLLPAQPAAIARVRMVQMVALNELVPAISPLVRQYMGFGESPAAELESARQRAGTSLGFFEGQLAGRAFFGGDRLSLADIVLGISAAWFEVLGISLADYPALQAWTAQIAARPAWQTTQPSEAAIAALRLRAREMMAKRANS